MLFRGWTRNSQF